MDALLTLLSPLGAISVIFLFFILARLSEKLGAVTRMPPRYRWFWVGIGFLDIALISQLLRITVILTGQSSYAWLNDPIFYLLYPSRMSKWQKYRSKKEAFLGNCFVHAPQSGETKPEIL